LRRHFASIALAVAALAGGAAFANDGAAERAAGGLVFVHNEDVDMVSEELFIAADQVRVRYRFRNRAPRDVRILVAFPMPDYELAEPIEGDVVWPSDFVTEVDGRRVETEVERRALLGGVDHSDRLRRLGIPIAYQDDEALQSALWDRLQALSPGDRQQLVDLGLLRRTEAAPGRPLVEPLWSVRETWHWEQVFPAGREVVIEHRYRPGAGGIVTTALTSPEWRASEDGRAWMERFCVDPAFLRGLDLAAARSGIDGPTIPETWVSYILTTGSGWRSPIGEFTLVVDKGQPGNLVSFCGEDVRRIGPTRFEMRRRNWRPDRNLDILFLSLPPSPRVAE
jgi:hypothetical protein